MEIYPSGPEPSECKCDRLPDQTGISQACYIVEIHHSGPELSKLYLMETFAQSVVRAA